MGVIAGYISSSIHSLLWVISCVGLGTIVLRRMQSSTRLELLLFQFIAGVVSWVVISIFLALSGIFHPLLLRICVYIFAVLSIVVFGRQWWASLKGAVRFELPVLTLGIILLGQALFTFIPETAFDSLLYHLPLARYMLDTGRIEWTPFIFNAAFPRGYQLLQSIGLAIGGDVSAALVSWWFAFGTCLALIAIGNRLGSWRLGLWSAIALSLTPLWFWEGHVGYSGSGMAFGVSVLALAILIKAPGIVLGAAMGWIAGCKYFCIEIAFFALCIWLWHTRPGWKGALIAIITAFVIGGFWYARNYYLFFNPIFPYYNEWFASLGEPRAVGALDCVWDARGQFASFASPTTLSGWLTVPFRIIFNPSPSFTETSEVAWQYTGLIALFWPLSIILIIKQRKELLGVYLLTLVSTLMWAFVHGIIYLRFLNTLLPLMYILTFAFFYSLIQTRNIAPRIFRIITLAACIVAVVHLIGPTTNRSLAHIPLTEKERQIFLEANIDGWPIIRELNKLDPKPQVYYLYGENTRFYCDFPLYADWRDPYGFTKLLEHASSGEELARWLSDIGVDVFLIDDRRIRLFNYKPVPVIYDKSFTDTYELVLDKYNETTMFVRIGSGIHIEVSSWYDE